MSTKDTDEAVNVAAGQTGRGDPGDDAAGHGSSAGAADGRTSKANRKGRARGDARW